MDGRSVRRALIALTVVLTWAVYEGVHDAAFVFEDIGTRGWPPSFPMPGRWLTQLTLAWTPDPGVAHLVNVGLHLLNTVLVGALASAFGIAILPAVILFGLHPLNASAVAYVSGRTDVLLTTWALIGAVAVARAPWRVAVPVALLMTALALVTKEIGVVVGPLLLLTAVCVGRVRSWRALLPILGAGAIGGVALLRHPVHAWITMSPYVGGAMVPVGTFLQIQLLALGQLLRLVIVPVGFTIDHDPVFAVARWDAASTFTIALVGLLLLTALVVWAARRASRWTGAWLLLWPILALAPRFVIPQQDFVVEHHLYLPMVAFAIVLAWALEAGLERLPMGAGLMARIRTVPRG